MKSPLLFVFLLILLESSESPGQIPPKKTSPNQSFTYDETISRYKLLDSLYRIAALIPYGKSDIGKPVHLFVIDKDTLFGPSFIHEKNKCILLINNGIHPGEPDGIDASLQFAEELLSNPAYSKFLDHVVVCIIPMLNIDGSLNRSCCSRANQNGPELYGFRGNAQNLDLNRDLIKCDSKNILNFITIFRQWDPDVLIDTHVSDGADYQYNISLISSQADKLYPPQTDFMKNEFTPALFRKMKAKNSEMIPYVNMQGYEDVPDSGISDFLDTPRFLTGYAALFQTYGFIVETHMLKPFPERVKATLNLLHSILEFCSDSTNELLANRAAAKKEIALRKDYPVNWKVDTTQFEWLDFKGYTATHKVSEITGLQRLYYDHSQPYQKKIKYFNHYIAADTIIAPTFYVLPQAWMKIYSNMLTNQVRVIPLETDTFLEVEYYQIQDFHTVGLPYEGHYLHDNTHVKKFSARMKFYKGDYLVPVFQEANRLIIETLEPQCEDSYFNWGFFDAILQQKEWFSSYVFEDLATSILKKNKSLKKSFEERKKNDPDFAKDAYAQLYFIYRNSEYFEQEYYRYPVYRLLSRENHE